MANEQAKADRFRELLLGIASIAGLWTVAELIVHHRNSLEPQGSGIMSLFLALAFAIWVLVRDRREKYRRKH
jgi:hypothetical protein